MLGKGTQIRLHAGAHSKQVVQPDSQGRLEQIPEPGQPGQPAGENPHQAAAFYTDNSLREAGAGGVATSIVHWGKEMSYNNYLVSQQLAVGAGQGGVAARWFW